MSGRDGGPQLEAIARYLEEGAVLANSGDDAERLRDWAGDVRSAARALASPVEPSPQSVPEGLRERLEEIAERVAFDAMNVTEQFDELAVCFAEEVGYLPPGKDSPSLLPQSDAGVDRLERRQEWERWLRHETAERNRQAREDRAWLLSLVGGG